MKLTNSRILIILIVILLSCICYSLKISKSLKQNENHTDEAKQYYIDKGNCCSVAYKNWIAIAYFHGSNSDICFFVVDEMKHLISTKISGDKFDLVQKESITYQTMNMCSKNKKALLNKIEQVAYHNVYYGKDHFSKGFLKLAQILEKKRVEKDSVDRQYIKKKNGFKSEIEDYKKMYGDMKNAYEGAKEVAGATKQVISGIVNFFG